MAQETGVVADGRTAEQKELDREVNVALARLIGDLIRSVHKDDDGEGWRRPYRSWPNLILLGRHVRRCPRCRERYDALMNAMLAERIRKP